MPPSNSTALQEWIDDAKAATLSDALNVLKLNLKQSGASYCGPCPNCGGTDRFWANTRSGRFGCRGCRPKEFGPIGLVMFCECIGFIEACAVLNGSAPPDGRTLPKPDMKRRSRDRRRDELRARRELQIAEDTRRRLTNASGIWNAAGPLGGAGVEYLKARGIDPSVADDQLRFHPGLPHPEGGTFPAIVARVAGSEGDGVGVWRIYLKHDGSGKAPVNAAKLGLGVVKGGACRIGGIWPHICLAEGVETALAVRELVPGKLPCWAALSTSGMRGVVLPDEIESVDIFADGDPPKPPSGNRQEWMPSPGLSAAHDLKTRLESEGRRVVVRTPPLGTDWLDCLAASKRVAA